MNYRPWLLAFALAAAIPGTGNAYPSVKLQGWLTESRCVAFPNLDFLRLPMARNAKDDIFIGLNHLPVKQDETATYYDPVRRVALTIDTNLGAVELRRTGPPPLKVPVADLNLVGLKSGVRIGTRSASVRAILGKPFARSGCGEKEYSYVVDRLGTQLIVTLRRGVVTGIEFMPAD